MTQAPATPSLVERLRSYYPPICQEAADALEAQQARIAELEAESAALTKALTEVRDLEPVPFERGLDWTAIAACEDCQNYKEHPLMRGICNTHRRPLYDRESHDGREEKRLGWRAKCIAREALSSQGRHAGGEDSSSRSQPCGVGPSDLTDPQSQHSDGEGW